MGRNITLDYFKMFLCILIITIHIPPLFSEQLNEIYGWFIYNGIARTAVPIFFIINGYFLHNKIHRWEIVKKYLSKLTIIYISFGYKII